MRIHAILHGTRANGPGLRTCIWFRGCNLGCPGCTNRATWDFTGGTQIDPVSLAHQIFAHCLPGTEGITISGGEPMHQAVALCELIHAVKLRRPDWSAGLFTGYSREELSAGSYELRDYRALGKQARIDTWEHLYPMLDFVKMGRWRSDLSSPNLTPNLPPLCTSANQHLVLPTTRYTLGDFNQNVVEYNIESDGVVTITGFPIKSLRA